RFIDLGGYDAITCPCRDHRNAMGPKRTPAASSANKADHPSAHFASAMVRRGAGYADKHYILLSSSFRLRSLWFVVNPCLSHGYSGGFQMRDFHRVSNA